MASILDIENALSDETTQEIVIKDWYWDEFLPKIDEDNIKNDYRLVYQSFTINEFMHLPYNITNERWDWLVKNQIVVKDNFNYENATNIEKWIYEDFHTTPIYKDCIVKYVFSDEFFKDYQKNVIERRQLSVMEDWMYDAGRLYRRLDKTINNFENYAWPIMYNYI